VKKVVTLSSILVLAIATCWGLAEEARKTGTVKVTTPGLILTVKGQTDETGRSFPDCAIPPEQEITLPEGHYDVLSAKLAITGLRNGKREVWTLESHGPLGTLANFTVSADTPTTLEGGPPLTVRITPWVGEMNSQGQPDKQKWDTPTFIGLSVQLAYIGKAGEEYAPRVTRGKGVGPNPKIRLLDEKGNVLDEGNYSFSTVKNCKTEPGTPKPLRGYHWKIPARFRGRVTVEVNPQLGPIAYQLPEEAVVVDVNNN